MPIQSKSLGKIITVILPRERECTNSVRFLDKDASPLANVYLDREWKEIQDGAKRVKVTVEIVD